MDARREARVAPGVYWTGAVDWMVRRFHGYYTNEGSSYNAYLLDDPEMPTLIDTVKADFAVEMIGRLRRLIDPERIRYIVMNHAENDHSGALPTVVRALPNATIVTNAVCKEHLLILYPELKDARFQVVSTTTPL